jgi:hypothetical protein
MDGGRRRRSLREEREEKEGSVASIERRRLSPAETRRFLDDYTRYRFGHVLSPAELADKAGVPAAMAEDLYAQKPIPAADQHQLAAAINVSDELLAEVAGYRDMADDLRQSLDRFFQHAQAAHQRQGHAA